MTHNEYLWHINIIKDRNHTLNLTFEQAEQVYNLEENQRTYSEKCFFSVREEWDYERSFFRKILNTEQINILEQNIQIAVENYQQSLIEQDIKSLKKIEFNKEIIKY